MPHPTDEIPTIERCKQDFLAFVRGAKKAPATIKAYGTDLAMILPLALGDVSSIETPITVLDRRTMRDAFAKFADDHAASSCARAQTTWRMFFDFLVSDDVLEGSPMGAVARVKVGQPEPKPFEGWEDDFGERLLRSCANGDRKGYGEPWPERDVAACATLLLSGIRGSEFCALNINSIEGLSDEEVIRVRQTKGAKWRAVPVEPALDQILGVYLESRKHRFPKIKVKRSDPLFLGIRSDGVTRMTQNQLRRLLESCLVGAGLQNRKPDGAMAHAFRHTYGTTLAADDGDVLSIAKLMGHSSVATTQNYMKSMAKAQRKTNASNRNYKALTHLQAGTLPDDVQLKMTDLTPDADLDTLQSESQSDPLPA